MSDNTMLKERMVLALRDLTGYPKKVIIANNGNWSTIYQGDPRPHLSKFLREDPTLVALVQAMNFDVHGVVKDDLYLALRQGIRFHLTKTLESSTPDGGEIVDRLVDMTDELTVCKVDGPYKVTLGGMGGEEFEVLSELDLNDYNW